MNLNPITYEGLKAVEINTNRLKMVVITGMGPRIAFFGRPGGANILLWGLHHIRRGDWVLRGGHRVWVTRPGAEESEEAYIADNDACTVSEEGDALVVTGGVLPLVQTQRGLKIRVLAEDTFEVTSFVVNKSPLVYSAGVWAPTCIDPAGDKEYAILLGDRRLGYDIVRLVIPRAFAGHSSMLNDPQIRFTQDFLIGRALGIESKRMVTAPHGIIGMTWAAEKLSFLKRARYNPNGRYPMDCNLALFIGQDNFMVELESYGEEQSIQPGAMISQVETWRVVDEVLDWNDAEHVIELMK